MAGSPSLTASPAQEEPSIHHTGGTRLLRTVRGLVEHRPTGGPVPIDAVPPWTLGRTIAVTNLVI